MKKRFTLLLTLCSLVLAVLPSFAQEEIELSQTFTSFDRQLTFDYPDGWEVYAESDGISIYPTEPVVNEFPDVEIQFFFLTDEIS